jgi:4-amino-4-deoxy-L-arabinose transferase-like glycosyltransferase
VYIRVRAGDPVPWRILVVFWVAETAGILLKGPAAPALALLTMATLSIADRNIRWIKALRPIASLMLTTSIVAPWFVAIEQATEGHFLADSLWQDLVPKLVGAQQSHGAPPGSYLALSLASFWPGSLFLVPVVIWGWRQRLLKPSCRSATANRASSSCSARQPDSRLQPRGIDSSQARAWLWSVIEKTRRSENTWRRAGGTSEQSTA